MTLDEDAETTVDHGARGRENDSNGQNSHHDGKERLLVREKGRREQREGRSRDDSFSQAFVLQEGCLLSLRPRGCVFSFREF